MKFSDTMAFDILKWHFPKYSLEWTDTDENSDLEHRDVQFHAKAVPSYVKLYREERNTF